MGDSFRDAAWDSQLDTMLDDLQLSVQGGETHGYKNGVGGQTSREFQQRQHGNTRETMEKVSRVAGGPGEGFTYREESSTFCSTTSGGQGVPANMGSKRAVQNGAMEQHMLEEKRNGTDFSFVTAFPALLYSLKTSLI